MKECDDIEPVLLATDGSPGIETGEELHPQCVDGDPGQMLVSVPCAGFDHFNKRHMSKQFLLRQLAPLLQKLAPDIVHFQHTLSFGYDTVRLVRTLFPSIPIVYTLHEFLPMCHNNGQMVNLETGRRCLGPAPEACIFCPGSHTGEEILLRDTFMRSQMSLVDICIAPSRFLMDRYVGWGIPEDRIRLIDYGRLPVESAPPRECGDGRRCRFGYFGQLLESKGILTLLEAIAMLDKTTHGDVQLTIHGANLEHQPRSFRHRYREGLKQARGNVVEYGSYTHGQMARLMKEVDWVVVPSVWWENSPLVIQEAFMHRRPVICSDIGGMAEKVTSGVNGLHFKAGSALSLKSVMEQAADDPSLWLRLRNGIGPVFPMADCVQQHHALYESLMGEDRHAAEATTATVPSYETESPALLDSIFIAGPERSGTSAMRNCLCIGAGLPGYNESHVAPLLHRLLQACDEYMDSNVLKRIRGDRKHHLIANMDVTRLKTQIAHLFCEFLDYTHSSRPRVLKTPGHKMLTAAPTVASEFPQSRFILMRRRGIENILSRQRKFPGVSFESHCRIWTRSMNALLQAREQLDGDRCLEFDQTDLASDPEGIVTRLIAFLGLDRRRRAGMIELLKSSRPEQSRIVNDACALGLAETGWTQEEQRTFAEICGPMMEAFGYSMDGGIARDGRPGPVRLAFVPLSHLSYGLIDVRGLTEQNYGVRNAGQGFAMTVKPGNPDTLSLTYRSLVMRGHNLFQAELNTRGNGSAKIRAGIEVVRSGDGSSVASEDATVAGGESLDWSVNVPELDGSYDVILSAISPADTGESGEMNLLWDRPRFVVRDGGRDEV